ncbi:hypothetical protein AB4138_10775 [Vibrio sp. 10N.286.52.C3]|uniref:Uncharacterized protein n=1 Tax=Vibrio splendidus TaxID=29497 RepID=A0A7Y4D2B2_VIBSP|nr:MULTISPECIES: hypothetical protein [Vibrio]NOJ11279.1 hypothetical protein [Vibrio splendidus]TKF72304.1 hypothetical protein FCV59_15085 [Vibrio sp. F13]
MKVIVKVVLILTFFTSSHLFAQQKMDKSPVAMAYVCWHLANGSGLDNDSDLFAKMISVLRNMPSFESEQHYELMGYAAQQVLELTSIERASMYSYGCLEPLKNIKQAEKQGMLD